MSRAWLANDPRPACERFARTANRAKAIRARGDGNLINEH